MLQSRIQSRIFAYGGDGLIPLEEVFLTDLHSLRGDDLTGNGIDAVAIFVGVVFKFHAVDHHTVTTSQLHSQIGVCSLGVFGCDLGGLFLPNIGQHTGRAVDLYLVLVYII